MNLLLHSSLVVLSLLSIQTFADGEGQPCQKELVNHTLKGFSYDPFSHPRDPTVSRLPDNTGAVTFQRAGGARVVVSDSSIQIFDHSSFPTTDIKFDSTCNVVSVVGNGGGSPLASTTVFARADKNSCREFRAKPAGFAATDANSNLLRALCNSYFPVPDVKPSNPIPSGYPPTPAGGEGTSERPK